jgi:hypothetical protein
MAALGFTLNTVTMLALVLMVGIVIDDAIVVLEHLQVHRRKHGALRGGEEATAEIALPVLATTMSLVVIFIPVSFMSSIWTLPLPVRVHRRQRDPDQPAGVVHADADDERRMFRRGDPFADDADSRKGFYGGSTTPMRPCWRLRCGAPGRRRRRHLVILSIVRCIPRVRQDFVPSGVDEAQSK